MQVSSATATFAMAFSSSMSVVEYYLLKRFPHPYGNQFEHHHTDLTLNKYQRHELLSKFSINNCHFLFTPCSSLLFCCGDHCCSRWTICGNKSDCNDRESIFDYLHFGCHNFYKRNITRYVSLGANMHIFLGVLFIDFSQIGLISKVLTTSLPC